jgi:hypothetical protein
MQGSLDESAGKLENAPPDILVRVSDLERRVAALENRSGTLPALKADVAPRDLPSVPAGIIPILGRALLGLAGAYLLRAIVESGRAPRIATVIAALIYAGAWLVSSIRTRAEETFRAVVYTVTAALIFAPLVWETTVRFQVLSPAEGALVLVLFVIAGYAVAWRRDLTAINRITTLAAAGTALGLLVATRDLASFTIALLAMALAAEYAACRDQFLGERWIAASSIDVALLVLTYVLTLPQGLPDGYRAVPTMLAVAIQMVALAIYFGSISFRTLARGLKITWFEAGQTTAVFAISIAGALQVTRGAAGAALGWFCMLSGAGAYLVAFALLDRRADRRNFHTYALWGLTLLLAGSPILFSGTLLTAIWGALAILAMSVGRRTGHIVLRAHACVYMIGAAAVSGLLRYCFSVSIEPGTPFAAAAPAAILAACAAVLCYAASGATPTVPVRIPAAIIAGLLCWSMLAFGWGMLTALSMNAAGLATLRTFLLCAVAIGMALAGSRWGRGELLWLQYPVMLFGAAKLLLEDFPNGSPTALALSLLSYGSALIILPRCRLGTQSRRS